jgi:glycosyltransferase involved in cell wall biosynthesis
MMTMLMEERGDESESRVGSLGVTMSCRLNLSIRDGDFLDVGSSLFKAADSGNAKTGSKLAQRVRFGQRSSRMNLLFVSHRSDVSGGEICLQRIMERLDTHSILVVLPEGAFANRLRQANIPIQIENGLIRMARSEDSLAAFKMAARFPSVVLRLRRQIRRFKADLVISNALGPLPYAGPAARLAGVPNVCIHHHPVLQPGTSDARLVSLLSRTCDGFIAVSDAMNRGLQASGVPAAKVMTIYNGLDVDYYAVAPAPSNLLRSQLHLAADVRLIGLVATISDTKGHHVVVETARLLRDSHSVQVPWRVVFIGGVFENSKLGTAYQNRLEKQIADAGLEEIVLFAGKQTTMREVYADLDVVLNASTEPEPFGTTIYEAMAMGKPVIASRLGGSPEIVDDGHAGFLTAPGDSRELAQLLTRILNREIDIEPMLLVARKRVEEKFDLRDTARRYLEYFATVVHP